MVNNKTILITGGTGSFGRKFTEVVFKRYKPKKVIVLSRDEFKQSEMKKVFHPSKYPIRYFLGDVRDRYRLHRAFEDVDYVIHAAALKQVPALEYNPTEAVKTNVDGANNIVNAAIDAGVEKVVALSTDKAVNPVNLYGATKLVSEKIFISGNAYAGGKVNFSIVRYGNVVGSRGSVVPLFLKLKSEGVKKFPITDERMTRFWVTLEQGTSLVFRALQDAEGGEIFVPKIPSMRIVDLARAIKPDCEFKFVGIRPGEKVHETLVSGDEARTTKDVEGVYVILPHFLDGGLRGSYKEYPFVDGDFVYRSDTNDKWVTTENLTEMVNQLDVAPRA